MSCLFWTIDCNSVRWSRSFAFLPAFFSLFPLKWSKQRLVRGVLRRLLEDGAAVPAESLDAALTDECREDTAEESLSQTAEEGTVGAGKYGAWPTCVEILKFVERLWPIRLIWVLELENVGI